jgi:hypothetical protein
MLRDILQARRSKIPIPEKSSLFLSSGGGKVESI